ncbi:MAG: class I SAM-dependent methyltransferase [Nitrospinae bacterium]|nr:class I SAM-dependent methyltransferase [Nitrospinota bacterium]
MNEITGHYESLLADVYTWMCGGREAKVRENESLFEKWDMLPRLSGVAFDLGAGPGFAASPLARRGYKVTAVDTSRKLLDELSASADGKSIKTLCADMMDIRRLAGGPVELVTVMGDTISHLPAHESLETLLRDIYKTLEPGGGLILSFRDQPASPSGIVKKFTVMADDTREFHCEITYERERIKVTDTIRVRIPGGWDERSGTYHKIRLTDDHVMASLAQAGFTVEAREVVGGLSAVMAGKGG